MSGLEYKFCINKRKFQINFVYTVVLDLPGTDVCICIQHTIINALKHFLLNICKYSTRLGWTFVACSVEIDDSSCHDSVVAVFERLHCDDLTAGKSILAGVV